MKVIENGTIGLNVEDFLNNRNQVRTVGHEPTIT